MSKKTPKILSFLICLLLIFQQTGFSQIAGELDISSHLLGLRNSFIRDTFRPLHLRCISYDALSNNFNLLIDKGDSLKGLSPKDKAPKPIGWFGAPSSTGTDPEEKLQQEAKTLMSYFFTGLALPNESFWVNLRPDSPNNIIDDELARTDIGKIFLEADLQLKKDTALFTSPQTPEGKEYWNKLYKKAEELYGYENITIPTLTRPWIVPGEIIIREAKDNAYIYKATLKVMLEQDYLKDSTTYAFKDQRSQALNEYSSQLIRELIIPKITKEVNSSKRYAPLRQVYYSLILAQWFKERYKKGLSPQGTVPSLIDSQNLSNLTSKEEWSKTTYFNAYKKSFAEGEYNIKEPVYTPTGQVIRSYFSGGIKIDNILPMTFKIAGPPVGNKPYLMPLRVSANGEPLAASPTKPAATSSPASADSAKPSASPLNKTVNSPLYSIVLPHKRIIYSETEISKSIPKNIRFISSNVDRDELYNRLDSYGGEVYYPCAGRDIYSLVALISMFPHAKRFIMNDNFVQSESGLPLPYKWDKTGILYYLEAEYRTFADDIGTVKMEFVNDMLIKITITVEDELFRRILQRDSIEVLYRIGDYKNENGKFGIVYIQAPGLAGRLSEESAFWEKIISLVDDNGHVIVSQQLTRGPFSSLLSNLATVSAHMHLIAMLLDESSDIGMGYFDIYKLVSTKTRANIGGSPLRTKAIDRHHLAIFDDQNNLVSTVETSEDLTTAILSFSKDGSLLFADFPYPKIHTWAFNVKNGKRVAQELGFDLKLFDNEGRFKKEINTNTSFFRDKGEWLDKLETYLGRLVRSKIKNKDYTINIKSLGTSCEELYSLVLIVERTLSEQNQDISKWDVKIIGYDTNPILAYRIEQGRFRTNSYGLNRADFRRAGYDFDKSMEIREEGTREKIIYLEFKNKNLKKWIQVKLEDLSSPTLLEELSDSTTNIIFMRHSGIYLDEKNERRLNNFILHGGWYNRRYPGFYTYTSPIGNSTGSRFAKKRSVAISPSVAKISASPLVILGSSKAIPDEQNPFFIFTTANLFNATFDYARSKTDYFNLIRENNPLEMARLKDSIISQIDTANSQDRKLTYYINAGQEADIRYLLETIASRIKEKNYSNYQLNIIVSTILSISIDKARQIFEEAAEEYAGLFDLNYAVVRMNNLDRESVAKFIGLAKTAFNGFDGIMCNVGGSNDALEIVSSFPQMLKTGAWLQIDEEMEYLKRKGWQPPIEHFEDNLPGNEFVLLLGYRGSPLNIVEETSASPLSPQERLATDLIGNLKTLNKDLTRFFETLKYDFSSDHLANLTDIVWRIKAVLGTFSKSSNYAGIKQGIIEAVMDVLVNHITVLDLPRNLWSEQEIPSSEKDIQDYLTEFKNLELIVAAGELDNIKYYHSHTHFINIDKLREAGSDKDSLGISSPAASGSATPGSSPLENEAKLLLHLLPTIRHQMNSKISSIYAMLSLITISHQFGLTDETLDDLSLFKEDFIAFLDYFKRVYSVEGELKQMAAAKEFLSSLPAKMASLKTTVNQLKQSVQGGRYEYKLGAHVYNFSDEMDLILSILTGIEEIFTVFLGDNEKTKVDLNTVVKKALNLSSGYARGNHASLGNVEYQEDYASDLPLIYADAGKLAQVFLNLFINAYDAIAEKDRGQITVTTSLDRTDNYVMVEIKDNGSGITSKDIQKVFDPYFTTKGDKGTGLGLSIARRIIEDNNGSIRVESELGKGTTFTITLPAASPLRVHDMHAAIKNFFELEAIPHDEAEGLFLKEGEIESYGYKVIGGSGFFNRAIYKSLKDLIGIGIMGRKRLVYSPVWDGRLSVEFAEQAKIDTQRIAKRLIKQGKDRMRILVIGSGTGLDAMTAVYQAKLQGLYVALDAIDIQQEAVENTEFNFNLLLKDKLTEQDLINIKQVKEGEEFESLDQMYDLILFNAPDAIPADQITENTHKAIKMDSEVFRNILLAIKDKLFDSGVALVSNTTKSTQYVPEGLEIIGRMGTQKLRKTFRLVKKDAYFKSMREYVLTQNSGSGASPLQQDLGGIDMRHLAKNTIIEKQGLSPQGTVPVFANKELEEIQRLIQAGIIPATKRLEECRGACSAEALLSCIADILRIEEERVTATEAALKNLLASL